jgi:hypothetical protein
MLTKKEKDNIRERAIFESEIKKSLEEPENKKSWVNSNIAILIIGSIISGILVPLFQYSHKSIEWRRQNQYENYKLSIENKENFLKEFIVLSALLSEIIEVSTNTDPKIFSKQEIINQFSKIQKERFHQVSKINYLLIFINNTKIRELFTEHTNKSLLFVTSLKENALSKYEKNSSSEKYDNSMQSIGKQLSEINALYTDITDRIYLEIRKVKDENNKLHML